MPRSLPFLFPRLHMYLTIDRSHDQLSVLYVNMANYYPLTPELRASQRPVTECFNASTSPVNTDHPSIRISPPLSLTELHPYFTPTRHFSYSHQILTLRLYVFRDHPTTFLAHPCTPFPDDRPTLSDHRQLTHYFDNR
jgi:hypothetical protein